MASLAVQTYAFLVLVLTGIAWSVCFDIYHAWRELTRPSRLAGDASDLLFGALSAALVAAGMFLSNWGELRLYVFIGLALGAGCYFWLASPVVRPAVRWALRTVARVLRWSWRVATWPLRLLLGAGRFAGRGGTVAARRGATAARAAARAAAGHGRRGLAWFRRVLPFLRG